MRAGATGRPWQFIICAFLASWTSLAGAAAVLAASEQSRSPAWLSDDNYDAYAREDRVLKPWTPVEVGKQRVAVWGRVITWRPESLLPASITSQGVELLAGPMRLVVTQGGRDEVVPLRHWRVSEQRKSQAVITVRGKTAAVSAEVSILAEYDGFLLMSLRFTDQSGPVDAVRVITSLPAAKTTLYQTFARPLAGWITDEPIKLSWRASQSEPIVNFYHWLGNEDRGLGFAYESLQGWAPASEDSFCTITRNRRSVVYTINLVERPVLLDGRVFRIGIQATPIKPLPPDYHSMISTGLDWHKWAAWEQMPENIDTVVIWPPGIMRGLNDPYHVNAEALAHAVKYVHDRGVGALFTGCPQKLGPFSDEFEAWKDEWMNLPESVLDWEGTPHLQNCGRSYTLRKWLFYGWAKEIVERFGLEGIYFDGWQAGTMACYNERHGCGWVDESGRRHLTVPLLEGREFNKCMAAWLEDHVTSSLGVPETAPDRGDFPRYHYRIHSWEFVAPVMGFATSWLTGEFSGWPLKGVSTLEPEGTYGKSLGLGLFRARCLSTNWGVPNMFHVIIWEAGEHPKRDRQSLMAYAWLLPHGVPLGEARYMNHHVVKKVSGAMMEFGTRRAVFTPCWQPNPYWRISKPRSAEVVVATWAHTDRRDVLTVLSNLQVGVSAAVTMRWIASWRPHLKNALTGEALRLTQDSLEVRLKPETFILIRATG
ncbi:MAG: hypothetical protein H5T86_04785 [Armatimonadetes bacterium]|nr:hypothetical protein [Armatimonadota bacterium]